MSDPVLITFLVYFVLLLIIGLYFCRRNKNVEDYLLGGRGMGVWVTALSAQASDMSGWLLMGLPGAVYLSGLSNIWIAVGLFAGTALNWRLVSTRLRIYTETTRSITLPCFFEARFADPTGLVRTISAIIVLIFFTIYASAHMVTAGKLFESVFNINYSTAVLVGSAIIIIYTFLGGFLAVCWTDLLQGMLMVVAIVAVPVVAFLRLPADHAVSFGPGSGFFRNLLPQQPAFTTVAVVSLLAWGLGYFGQPHILVRFMSVKSISKLKRSMTIAIIWVSLSLAGAVAAGVLGTAFFQGLSGGEEEKIFICIINRLFNPWFAGIMLAAILSAVMSTIDSQLLVASSALTEDFYQKAVRKNATEKELIIVGRLCVIIISAIAVVLALKPDDTILGIVAYAWAGLGASFGPVILFSLFSRKTTWLSVLAGMVAGTVAVVIWKRAGLSGIMYEIVPGFGANCITIWLVNMFICQADPFVLSRHDRITAQVHRCGDSKIELNRA